MLARIANIILLMCCTTITIHAQESSVQNIVPLNVVVKVFDDDVAFLENGDFSIQIRKDHIPLKSDAMRDYLEMELPELEGKDGVYFGDKNQFLFDRDAAMLEIPGLTVYGVDLEQETIIEGVIPIGIGMDATQKKLQEILNKPFWERPAFIGFDVDGTILGGKENFLKHRGGIAERIANLAIAGTQIVFFSDGQSGRILKLIAEPLAEVINKKKPQQPISIIFYVGGIINKIKMHVQSHTKPLFIRDDAYKSQFCLNKDVVMYLSDFLGGVSENEKGKMYGTGVLSEYYFKDLTIRDSLGKCVRNYEFYPEYVTKLTKHGNVVPPSVKIKDYNPYTGDAYMFLIGKIPSEHRAVIIHTISSLAVNETDAAVGD